MLRLPLLRDRLRDGVDGGVGAHVARGVSRASREPVVPEGAAHEADAREQRRRLVVLPAPRLQSVVQLGPVAQRLCRLLGARGERRRRDDALEPLGALVHEQRVEALARAGVQLRLLGGHRGQPRLQARGQWLVVPLVRLDLLQRDALVLVVLEDPLEQVLAARRQRGPAGRNVARLVPHLVLLLPPDLLQLVLEARVVVVLVHLKREEAQQHDEEHHAAGPDVGVHRVVVPLILLPHLGLLRRHVLRRPQHCHHARVQAAPPLGEPKVAQLELRGGVAGEQRVVQL
mmetsp:Transcript_6722/g.17158  ORF Transcript_6722/g.17158 Transcript_6722/m.17158 type:complete len:287 (-) Transcript_6722:669-1529(-)